MYRMIAGLVASLALCPAALADGPQMGVVKSVDPDKRVVTITADGKDLEFAVSDDTKLMGPDKQPLADGLKNKGLKAGADFGLAINPETPGAAALPYLEEIDLLLVMTVHPGFGGQELLGEVLPKLRSLRAEAERRDLDLPIGVDGGVKEDTIGAAYGSGGDVLVVGSGLYRQEGDLRPIVAQLRAAARAGATTIDAAVAPS